MQVLVFEQKDYGSKKPSLKAVAERTKPLREELEPARGKEELCS
jgi:hypothetical protein